MKSRGFRTTFAIGALLITALACSFIQTPAFPGPGATPAPATGATPLAGQVTLTHIPFSEKSDAPKYELSAEIPTLQGSDDSRVADFNARMNGLVLNEMEIFKRDLLNRPPLPPDLDVSSLLDERYTLVSPAGSNFLSLKLVFAGYVAGAAHPYEYTMTVNYDLERGHEVSLDELFLPGSSYLESLAAYCKSELGTHLQYSEGDPFETGSDPLPENYRRWNVAPDGLLITFDIYQVAPYVSGPQTVLVPYSALANVIDLQGPLAGFIQ